MSAEHGMSWDCVVVGGGVVGLACAARIARGGHSVLVVERERRVGSGISSRNSGVIHAGIYYPAHSLKARLCLRGRQLLYERVTRHGVAHRKTGKWIVASSAEEVERLEVIAANAAECGVRLQFFEGNEVRRRQPLLDVQAGLWSKETGIVDPHELVYDYQREARAHGATVVLQTELASLQRSGDGWTLQVDQTANSGGPSRVVLTARSVVNAAGLGASEVAKRAGVDIAAQGWQLHLCKGDYFALQGRMQRCTEQLIYPVPSHAGLGVHLTVNLAGEVTAGPDAEYIANESYDVDATKLDAFAAAVRRYMPAVRREDLAPAYAGIRPKLQGLGQGFRDFVIDEQPMSSGLWNLVGIESPGLTASEAISEEIYERLQESGRLS